VDEGGVVTTLMYHGATVDTSRIIFTTLLSAHQQAGLGLGLG